MNKKNRNLGMKKINLLLIVVLVFSLNLTGQIIVKSEVKEAIIFSNQAQLTREQTVKLEKGNNLVKFVGLERSIVTNSVQVSGTNGITVISNYNRNETTDMTKEPLAIRKLNDSIQVIRKKEQLGSKKVKNLQAEKNAILYNKSANGANSGFNLDNMIDLAEYYRANLDKIDELIYDKNLEIRKYRTERRNLEKKMKEMGYKRTNMTMNVEVISDKAQTVSMKLVYVANSIGWTPFYEIKSNGIGSKVEAICKAKIHQNSTVDWKNVVLTLSTTNPTNIGTLPTVHPWVLRFQGYSGARKDYRAKGKSNRAYSYSQSNSSYPQTAEVASYDSKSMKNYTTATNNMVSREFKVSLPYSVKGTKGKAVVELESYELSAEYLYYAAPKYNCSVFLIANISDWEQYNFLPGSASLFLEGSFVGTTFINPNATTDTLSLILGTDKNIVVERKKIKDLSRNTLIGGKKKVDMGIQITVKNKKGKEVELVLEDQVPITSDESIEIEVKDISGAKKEDGTGKLTWRKKIKAGESKVFKIKYKVTYPKNKPLSNF